MNFCCRHCKTQLKNEVIDLGHQPASNSYITKKNQYEPEKKYPLKVFVCHNCWLMQIPQYIRPENLFTPDYAYLSSTSKSWCEHAKKFARQSINKLQLTQNDLVLELASNDGYLLQYFSDSSIPCVGIEPTKLAADIARKKGIKTYLNFFSFDYAESLIKNDVLFSKGVKLIIANNVVAHVPDINDFIKGIKKLLHKEGFASIEFPHLLSLLEKNQFDTIYHEHYSYFSLHSFSRIVESVGMVVDDIEYLNTHGGSLRVWITHQDNSNQKRKVKDLFVLEERQGINTLKPYEQLQKNAITIKNELLYFLLNAKNSNDKILGYGAAAKGNTLLNYAGISKDLLPFIVDKSKSKQGKYMPGSRIPILDPEELIKAEPDKVLVLPWNLIDEIKLQLDNYKLVTAVPSLKVWS